MSVNGEDALIVYDAQSNQEHFIRRASFDSTAADFGFLVPTPNPPELGEVDDSVFDILEDAVAPEVEYVTKTVLVTCGTAAFEMLRGPIVEKTAAASSEVVDLVEVLSTARVAGLDATVLRATDTEALTRTESRGRDRGGAGRSFDG